MAPKWGPKWSQNDPQNEPKMDPNLDPKRDPKMDPKMDPDLGAKTKVFHWFYKENDRIRSQGAESASEDDEATRKQV